MMKGGGGKGGKGKSHKLLREIIGTVGDVVTAIAGREREQEGVKEIEQHTAEELEINEQDDNQNTLLHMAIISRSYAIAEKLIEKGADVDIKNKAGFTPLHEAAVAGNLGLVNKILEKQPRTVNDKNNPGLTALHEAILNRHLPIVDRLLDHHADVNTKNNAGFAPMHEVAIHNHPSVIEHMLESHADINIKNNEGLSPLYESIIHKNIFVAEKLLDNGANANVKNKLGMTPLHECIIHGHLSLAEKLLDNGADVNAKNHAGFAPVHEVIVHNRLSLLNKLLEKGANINMRNNHGYTPLHEAVIQRRYPAIEMLLKQRGDASIPDNKGRTPLQLAKEIGDFNSQKLLQQTQPARSRRQVAIGGSKLSLQTDASLNVEHIRPRLEAGTSNSINVTPLTQEFNNTLVNNTVLLMELVARKSTGKNNTSPLVVEPVLADRYLKEKVELIDAALKRANARYGS